MTASLSDLGLLPHHRALIEASAISPEVAAARGYRSVTVRAELQRLGFSPAQRLVPALLHPVLNVRSENGLYQIRPDAPRIVNGKALKYETPVGSRLAIDVPPSARPMLADPRIPLLITEGIRKADSAVSVGLCCIDLLGVWGFRGSNVYGGLAALGDWAIVPLNRDVFTVFDSDVMVKAPVQRALAALAKLLRTLHAQSVNFIYLPPGPHGEKTGLDDYLAAGHTPADLFALATDELRRPVDAGDDDDATPQIAIAGRRLHEISDDSLGALARVNTEEPRLFVRGGALARLTRRDGSPAAEALSAPALRDELDRAAHFVQSAADGATRWPPNDVVQSILARAELPLPRLEGIISAPGFLPSGELLAYTGYHAASGLYVAVDGLDGVRADMPPAEALSLLRDELLGEFPFIDAGSRAHALGLLLQPFAREFIDGLTPLHLIDAPARGTGKGLLAEVVSLVATGASAPVMAVPRDEDELEKRITATLLAGHALILLDNVMRLDQKPLDAALTADPWRGRLLGQSKMLTLRQRATWMATGNNVTLSDEMVRRTALIRLDARVERPEERAGWRHDPLPAWARQNRPALVSACLSLVQAWLDAGRPDGTRTLGRYEAWARVIGGILDVAGIPGFLTGRDRLYRQSDSESAEWLAFCEAWWQTHGADAVTAGELLAVAKDTGLLAALWVGKGDISGAQRLGHALGARRDRLFGPFAIRLAGRSARTHSAQFALERCDPDQNHRNPADATSEPNSESERARAGCGVSAENPAANPAVCGVSERACGVSEQNPAGCPNLKRGFTGVSVVLERPVLVGDVRDDRAPGGRRWTNAAGCRRCGGTEFVEPPGGDIWASVCGACGAPLPRPQAEAGRR